MPSPIDKIFKEIFGHAPKKDGVAFEKLAAIASHIIDGGEVKHDDKLRGEFSKSLYQLDVHHLTKDNTTMGEAKDYTIRKSQSKVGRPDLQKLGGALPDLKEIDNATFFSATGYTKPAKQYADQAENIIGKPITLYGLRPSTELDENGFIKTIAISIHILMPQPQNAKWLPHITPTGQDALKTLLKEGEDSLNFNMGLRCFYDKNGAETLTLQELTSHSYGEVNQDTGNTHACYVLKGRYMNINGVMAEINGLEYEMPYSNHTQEIRITDESENRLTLLDKDGNALKIITDKQLQEYEFDDEGNLTKR